MQVDFYFGPGSRYSYLAATQLPRIRADTGAAFRWIPVLSGDLVARTGGVHRSPQDVDWRTTDVARWADHYGVPLNDIDFTADWRLWALACVAAQLQGRTDAFARRLYQLAYGEGVPPQSREDLTDVARDAELDLAAFEAALDDPRTAATYDANLAAALAAGAFGVPTFVTPDGAVFWGQDRLPLLVDHLRAKGG